MDNCKSKKRRKMDMINIWTGALNGFHKILLCSAFLFLLISCSQNEIKTSRKSTETAALEAQLKSYKKEQEKLEFKVSNLQKDKQDLIEENQLILKKMNHFKDQLEISSHRIKFDYLVEDSLPELLSPIKKYVSDEDSFQYKFDSIINDVEFLAHLYNVHDAKRSVHEECAYKKLIVDAVNLLNSLKPAVSLHFLNTDSVCVCVPEGYYPIKKEGFRTIAEMRLTLRQYFTDKITEKILTDLVAPINQFKGKKIYISVDNTLFARSPGEDGYPPFRYVNYNLLLFNHKEGEVYEVALPVYNFSEMEGLRNVQVIRQYVRFMREGAFFKIDSFLDDLTNTKYI